MKYNKGFVGIGLILAIILGVAVVGGGAYYIKQNSNNTNSSDILPNSFTIEMYANHTSSGASRIYNGELTFLDNKLINGFQNYKVLQGGGCTTDCEKYTECIINNQKWIDKNDGSECKLETFISNTKDGIEQQIKNKEIIRSEDFTGCHYSTCYIITEDNTTNNENIIIQPETSNNSKVETKPVVNNENKYDEFASCLKNNGAVFYGTFWCPHCNSQKELFGSSKKLLPYVECSTPDKTNQNKICIDKKIESYPTWEFKDGSRLFGEIKLETLAQKTSCLLPNDIN